MKQLIDCRCVALRRFEIEKGRQPKHSFFYILSGEIELLMEGVRVRVGENTLLSFPDHVPFERRMLAPTEMYYVRYEAAHPRELPAGVVEIGDTGRLLSTLQYLTLLNDIPGTGELKNSFLADIFHQIEAQALIADVKKDRVMTRVQYFFEKNMHRKISLAEAARVACLSPSGLNHHFKKSVGVTPMEYLTEMRLERAQALLCHTKDPISGIAAACGFENPYYFSNTFKKHKGESPSSYRRKYEI